jgi:hypothetical protein
MTRNAKIALGCGGGGCLGLILLVGLVGVLIFTGIIKAPGIYSPPDRNSNYNYNSNRNSNFNTNANTNDNSNSNSDSSSTMADDDKHKLYQAAAGTQDQETIRKVWMKLGLMKASGALSDDYGPFVREHIGWLFKNAGFIQTVNTPEKARAYVDAHIDD